MFGSTVGLFSDRFGIVLRKSAEKVEKSKFPEVSGSIFPTSGCPKQLCLAYSRIKNPENLNILFFYYFRQLSYIGVGGMGGAGTFYRMFPYFTVRDSP